MTPSYNQREFIEETIRSILLQGYPNLEYIIMDGGSTDGAVDIIRRYERWLDYWSSERDGGQTFAILKGIGKARGQIFNWICSDDRLEKSALQEVANIWRPESLVAGNAYEVRDARRVLRSAGILTVASQIDPSSGEGFYQPSLWFNTPVLREREMFDPKRQHGFDWELIVRYLQRAPQVIYSDKALSSFVIHTRSKTGSEGIRFNEDRRLISEQFIRESEFRAHTKILRKRIYFEERQLAAANKSGAVGLVHFMLLRPRSLFDRFMLGALRKRIQRLRF